MQLQHMGSVVVIALRAPPPERRFGRRFGLANRSEPRRSKACMIGGLPTHGFRIDRKFANCGLRPFRNVNVILGLFSLVTYGVVTSHLFQQGDEGVEVRLGF